MEPDRTSLCGKECICDGPGRCPCFGVLMNENLHRKCKSGQNWRDNFSNFFTSLASEEVRSHNAAREDAFMDQIKQQEIARRKEEKDLDDAMAEIESRAKGIEMEGIGDFVENVLSKFGVTQERVQKALGTKDCGCDKRKQFLNQLFPFARKNDEPKEEDSP